VAVLLSCVGLSACGGSSSHKASQGGAAVTTSSGTGNQAGGTATNAALRNPNAAKVVVVRIAGKPITLAEVEHQMAIGVVKKEVPDAPSYTACVAHMEAIAAKSGQGQAKPTAQQLKSQCEQTYQHLMQEALRKMIASAWVRGEAADLGFAPSDAEVNRAYEEEKKQAYKREAEFQEYLKASGQTVSDLKELVRSTLAEEKIHALIKRKVGSVTQARIAAYYNTHKQLYTEPEKRDIEAIRTWTNSAISNAKKEIMAGANFGSVAKRVSIDRPSNEHGGVTLGITPGQEEKGLDEAIFAAKPHVLTGPLHLRQRYYIFEVTRVVPSHQPSFGEIEKSISQKLPRELQVQALESFVKPWRKKWRAKTDCSPSYVVQKCRQYNRATSKIHAEVEPPYELN
jgi:parvulin-like peptidyl-prolyl isomerase